MLGGFGRLSEGLMRLLGGSVTPAPRKEIPASGHQPSIALKPKTGLDLPPPPEVMRTPEERFLMNLDLRGKIVYDIGARDGLTTLFFSRVASQVIAYESLPAHIRALGDNLRISRTTNVIVRPIPLGARGWSLTMRADQLLDAGPIGEEILSGRPLALTGYLSIPVSTLDEDIAAKGLPRPDFIKIDVGGLEGPVLVGMAGTLESARPCLLIKLCGKTASDMRNLAGVLDLLKSFRYSAIHLETKRRIAEPELDFVEGHLLAAPQNEPFPLLQA